MGLDIDYDNGGFESDIEPNSIPSRYMQTFLNLVYYVGVGPNKFKADRCGSYVVRRNWLQMVICLVYITLTSLIRINGLRQLGATPEKNRMDPVVYFIAAREIGFVIYNAAILHALCFNVKAITDFLNLAATFGKNQRRKWQNYIRPKPRNWLDRNQVTLWMIGCTIYTLVSLSTIFLEIGERFSWNSEDFMQTCVNDGRSLLFFPPSAENYTSESATTSDSAFVLLNIFTYYAENVSMCCGDMLLLISAILLLACLQEFESKLENVSAISKKRPETPPQRPRIRARTTEFPRQNGHGPGPAAAAVLDLNFSDILEEYDQILQLINGLNKMIEILTFGLTLGSLPFFVNDLTNLLNPSSTAVLLRVLLYFAHLMMFLMSAATINKKTQTLENWLGRRENYLLVERCGATLGVKEMIAIQQGKNVGISIAGFFVITSGFVGSWISLLLTFAIVIMELRSS